MSDVNVLYSVTAAVLGALAIWTGYVLATAPDAVDESPPDVPPGPGEGDDQLSPAERKLRRAGKGDAPKITTRRPVMDETPPPSSVDIAAPSERAVAIAGKSAPVVVLPAMRQRLDSHSEIRDDGAETTPTDASPESMPTSGASVLLTSAIGRSEPASGPTEMSAIVDRHRLFLLADGRGQRVQNELVSAVMVNAVAAAFETDADGDIPKDESLPHRADRLRRATLAADGVLQSRGAGTDLDLSRVGILAAHFSPDNRHLYITTCGPDRAYRLRGQAVTHLNKPTLGAATVEGGGRLVDTVAFDVSPDDVYIFGSDAAFLALGDELRTVLTVDSSIDRVAAHFVAAATREGKSAGMTAIVVRVEAPRS